ncbi:VWA domain-containing protein [bacterium]|nr:VWA domain-containing protein [bacterium]QQR57304.1 MAG: VWA domain-containing protein [Candidatus Melainabacteria bacterium]
MRIIFSLLLSFICLSVASVFAAPPHAPGKPVLLKGSINQLLYLCATAGITLDKESLPASVIKIRLGSPASYYGVVENDKIESANIENNMLKLTLKRQGAKIDVTLPVSAQALRESTDSSLTAKNKTSSKATIESKIDKFMDEMPEPVMVPNAETARLLEQERGHLDKFKQLCAQASKNNSTPKKMTLHKDIKALGEYDVVLILDCSGSMSQRIGANINTSKWTWAQNQMISMSSQMENSLKKGIALMPFTDKYQLYQPCFGGEVQNIFVQRKPEGGTNLFPPLEDALSRAMLTKRPMVITILTDGGFGFRQEIKDLIVAAANGSAGPYDLRINLLLLDDKPIPPDIAALDRLTDAGAQYDIVEISEINKLRQRGLQQSIIDSLSR